MKRITAIEFVNYKAFYQNDSENRIDIPAGKNVLLYGENGSGKTSVYEGFKQFFKSSEVTANETPARHIKVPRTRIENEGQPNQTEVLNEVSVKITFTDENGNETKVFGTPTTDTSNTFIAQSNLLNSFFSYRELLRTYLMENSRDRGEFRLKFAQLIIENVLAKQKNFVTQLPFIKTWENLFIPRARFKEKNLEEFTQGLKREIHRINLLLPYLLKFFEEGFEAQMEVTTSEISYQHSARMDRFGKYPTCEIDLKVLLNGESTDNDEENHLTVLNEARLSALAISIYLASLINTPQNNFTYKILFLDDIFIGLDMSNRLPLLNIIQNFKKPVIEQFVDEEQDNKIVERIQLVDGVPQSEEFPFFQHYQIFISTYDRFWFEVAKREFETKAPNKWSYLEMFANQKDGLNFKTPIIYTSVSYLQKANYHYSKHDYPSCANHLRKALEERLKVLLPINEHYDEFTDTETGIKEIKKLKTLNQYLEKFIKYCDENGIDASELIDLKNLKDWYFNPFSHDNIDTPIFIRELDIAKSLVEKIEKFQLNVLLPAGELLYFSFNNGSGKVWAYKMELQENFRWIVSDQGNIFTNPKIHCYEKTIDDVITSVEWKMSGNTPWTLVKFFTNRWHKFIGNNEPVLIERIWNEINQESNGQPLRSILPV
ncbi:AAA family ATPase [Maribellus mangrovi]|uniref:AAA family ATPase n=1 Tax=Maribellus mangrovi TaxID=3133146 RepID=UPI0030EBC0A5